MALLEQPLWLSSSDSKPHDLQSFADLKQEPYHDVQVHEDVVFTAPTEPVLAAEAPPLIDQALNEQTTALPIGHSIGDEKLNKVSLAHDSPAENSRIKPERISFDDFIDLNELLFEWADSYDNKDWTRLARILAPSMIVDYSIVGHERIDDLPAADFVSMMSSPAFLGDPLVRTQHLMGARKFERVSDTEIIGHHQIRAAHQRYCPDGVTVERRGHGHSYIKHWYLKVEGEWKLKGLCPKIYWNEKDFDKIFLQLKGQR